LGSTSTVIDADILQTLLNKTEEPIFSELDGKLKIFEKPKRKDVYVLGVDQAKGTGEHDATIQVLKVTSFMPFKAKQVCTFKDNYTDIYTFSKIVHKTAIFYNNAYVMVENNAEGSTIVTKL
jgi:hypothetical protein